MQSIRRRLLLALTVTAVAGLTLTAAPHAHAMDGQQSIECLTPYGPPEINTGGGVNCLFIDEEAGTGTVTFLADADDGTFVSGYTGQPVPYDTCTLEAYASTTRCSVTFVPSGAYPAGGIDYLEVDGYPGTTEPVFGLLPVLNNPTVTASCTPSTAAVGTPTACTVSVSGIQPTGTAGISIGSGSGTLSPPNPNELGGGLCTLVPDQADTDIASCTITYTPTGTGSPTRTDTLNASSSGDEHNGEGTGSTMVTVPAAGSSPPPAGAAATTTAITAAPDPGKGGHKVTLTATITQTGGGTVAGPVGFTADGSPISGCTAVAVNATSPATATCSTLLPAGSTYDVTAKFAGSSTSAASSSTAINLKVDKQLTTTTLKAKVKSAKKSTVTLTAKVSGSGTGSPTGDVKFVLGTKTISTCKKVKLKVSTHTATCTVHATKGTKTYEAKYLGSGRSAASSKKKTVTVK